MNSKKRKTIGSGEEAPKKKKKENYYSDDDEKDQLIQYQIKQIHLLESILMAQKEANELLKKSLVSSSKRQQDFSHTDEEMFVFKYNGSKHFEFTISKKLLKGPILLNTTCGKFLKENEFEIPVRLGKCEDAMKQLEKFMHGERLDKLEEDVRQDLYSLSEFFALPLLELECLKSELKDINIPKRNKKGLIYMSDTNEKIITLTNIYKRLIGLLSLIEKNELIGALESFFKFLQGSQLVYIFETLKDIEGRNFHSTFPILFEGYNSLDQLKYHLLQEWYKKDSGLIIDEEKINLLSDSIEKIPTNPKEQVEQVIQ